MLRYILITISGLIALQVSANDTIRLNDIHTITCISVDAKGNIFVADDAFSLYKFDESGKAITNVNIKSYGQISSIDCTNPFELYVFYKNQNIVVFYDNMLNVRGEIRLNDYYLNNVSCIARSFDNNMWVVDLSQYKLLKINKKGEILSESPYLNNTLDKELNIYTMWEYNNEVYLADSLVGIYVFDMYATYITTHYIAQHTASIGRGQNIYFSINGMLAQYHTVLRNLVNTEQVIPANTSFSLFDNSLYYYHTNTIITSLMR
jgi:hypothetical protein